MKDIFTVMKFTIKDMVYRKSFIISTAILLVFIIIGLNVPNIIKSINGNDSSKDKLLVIDRENIYEGNLEVINQMDSDYDIEFATISDEEIKEKIENDEVDSAIIVERNDNNNIKMRYLLKDTTMMTGVPEEIISQMNMLYTNIQIGKLDLTIEQIESITPNFEFVLEQTGEKEAHGNVLAMMLMSIVLFYAIYFCAYQVSSSITTEKTSKIMETLVTSTSPRTIVIGKTIGIGVVGLLQLILLVGTAIITAKFCVDKELLDSIFDMSNITVSLGIITIIYFILGYFMYALLYALTGSTVSKPEDIQSANGPIAILAVIGFYLSYFTMMNPTSDLNLFASLLPLSSPFCMPFRIMMGLASTQDIIISIFILIVTIAIIAKIAIKIYSNAILNYGTKLRLKDIFKMYKVK